MLDLRNVQQNLEGLQRFFTAKPPIDEEAEDGFAEVPLIILDIGQLLRNLRVCFFYPKQHLPGLWERLLLVGNSCIFRYCRQGPERGNHGLFVTLSLLVEVSMQMANIGGGGRDDGGNPHDKRVSTDVGAGETILGGGHQNLEKFRSTCPMIKMDLDGQCLFLGLLD